MSRVLVASGSSEGQTTTIAERIGDVLAEEGHEPTLVHLKHPPADLNVESYDGVIIGASIHAGTHQRYVTAFVREHRAVLNRLPTAFYSVSLTAASAIRRARQRPGNCSRSFSRKQSGTQT